MARDYKHENELRKKRRQEGKATETTTLISSTIPKTLSEDFTAKVELEGTTKSAKIKELISIYTYGESK